MEWRRRVGAADKSHDGGLLRVLAGDAAAFTLGRQPVGFVWCGGGGSGGKIDEAGLGQTMFMSCHVGVESCWRWGPKTESMNCVAWVVR